MPQDPRDESLREWEFSDDPDNDYAYALILEEQAELENEEQERIRQAWEEDEKQRAAKEKLEFESFLDERERERKIKEEERARKQRYTFAQLFILAFTSLSLFYISFLSYQGMDLFYLIAENWTRVGSALLGVLFAMAFMMKALSGLSLESGTFQDIDKKVKARSLIDTIISRRDKPTSSVNELNLTEPVRHSVYEEASSNFESRIQEIVKSLDAHIALAEEKASKLLDTGTMYLRRGIYFYVATIVIWQSIILWKGLGPHIWLGVASCSLTFLVVEFLAAWYLKQYRNYVDSAISYHRVKSVFNRYLLSYHIINEFRSSNYREDKDALLKVLEEPIKWPELKEMNSNDFNYMMEAVSSFSSVIDKLRPSKSKNDTSN